MISRDKKLLLLGTVAGVLIAVILTATIFLRQEIAKADVNHE